MSKGLNFFIHGLIEKYPALETCRSSIEKAYDQAISCYNNGGKLIIFGNGGSAADAEHIVGELMKGFLKKRSLNVEERKALASLDRELGITIADKLQKGLPAISLGAHSALFTAFANDVDADLVFAQQIYSIGKKNDLVMGISTSGNSRNVVMGLYTAKAMGLSTLGLTGETGGRIKEFCDVIIQVPTQDTPTIQEYHLPIYHALCAAIEDYFFQD